MESIPLDHIRIDGGTQLRVETNHAVVAEYAEAMSRGAAFPPIEVVREVTGVIWLVDGFHRLHAAKAAGKTEIAATVTDGDLGWARLLACKANTNHGLQRSNETKRNVVREAIQNPLCATWSNAKIAEWCEVSAPFVSQIRGTLGAVPSEVIGKNGKVYKLADKLTEAHVYACPSLAQAEAWLREYADHKTLSEVLRRYVEHLRAIETAPTIDILILRMTFSLENAATKGDGLITAIAQRMADLGTEHTPQEWLKTLDAITNAHDAFMMARFIGLRPIDRHKALRAWLQWRDYNVSYKREKAETAALEARWVEHHTKVEQPKVKAVPSTAVEILLMGEEELTEFVQGTYSWRDNKLLVQAVWSQARHVAPKLIATCPDPICLCREYLVLSAHSQCPNCRETVENSKQRMVEEAGWVDQRRRLEGNPLVLMLDLLAKSKWDEGDEELLWDRVEVWRDQGCPGLAPDEQQPEAPEAGADPENDKDDDTNDTDDKENAA